MWKSKNSKMQDAYDKDENTRLKQQERMRTLESQNAGYKSELQTLQMKMHLVAGQNTKSTPVLPPISQDANKQLREAVEKEYFR